jgi:hypothetical protein
VAGLVAVVADALVGADARRSIGVGSRLCIVVLLVCLLCCSPPSGCLRQPTRATYTFSTRHAKARASHKAWFVCGWLAAPAGLRAFFRCSVGLLWPLRPLLAGRSRARVHRLVGSFCGEQGELVSTISGLWNGTRPFTAAHILLRVGRFTRGVPARAIGASY